MDIAGVVTSIGSGVAPGHVKIGDKIAFLNLDAPFSSAIAVNSSLVLKLPPSWSLEDGATIPLAFITAYHTLISIAHLTSHDTLLIHTASGGVGLAAVQLAKAVGAKIVATAGSPRKRAYLKNLGVEKVYNSRTLEFGAGILEATGGRGVDVVLNSLTGEGFVETSLKACAPNARFVEISKLNIWTREEVSAMRPDVSYSTVYIGDLDAPSLSEVLNKIQELIWAGQIHALPRAQFPSSGVISAVKYLQQGRHIGKVVLSLPTSPGTLKDDLFSQSGTYLITGGFGGIGVEIAKWIVSRGGRHLILSGRRLDPQNVRNTVETLLQMGAASVKPLKLEFAGNDAESRANLMSALNDSLPTLPLKGIFHCAGSLANAVLSNQTYEKFQETLHPKWNGTWMLHELSLELNLPLDYFVLFSSVAALVGIPGQANYAAANAAMDAIAWHRHSLGLPATSVNWGPWAKVGMAAEIEIPGFNPFSPEAAIERLESALLAKEVQVAITSDWRHIPNLYTSWAKPTYVDDGNKYNAFQAKLRWKEEEFDVIGLWKKATRKEEKEKVLVEFVKVTVRNILQLESAEFVDSSVSLHQLGMDSLGMINLNNKLANELKPLRGRSLKRRLLNTDSVSFITQSLLGSLECEQLE